MIAFLLGPTRPPGCVLARELREEQLGLLVKLWSQLQDLRLLFRGPSLGTKAARAPSFTRGLNADGPVSGLLLSLWEPSGNRGSSDLDTLPFLHALRALSTVFFAHGSGDFSEGEEPAEAISAGEAEGSAPCSGGAILMVTGLPIGLRCRRDQRVRWR